MHYLTDKNHSDNDDEISQSRRNEAAAAAIEGENSKLRKDFKKSSLSRSLYQSSLDKKKKKRSSQGVFLYKEREFNQRYPFKEGEEQTTKKKKACNALVERALLLLFLSFTIFPTSLLLLLLPITHQLFSLSPSLPLSFYLSLIY